MNCTSAREHFPALLDDRLAPNTAAGVRSHLALCPDCQRDYAALNLTLAALDALPVPAPSPRLRTSFYAALEAEKNYAAPANATADATATHHPAARHARLTLLRWILSPLAACALLAAGFLAGTRHAPPPRVVTAPPASAVDPATARELAELRHRVDSMDQLVSYSLLQERSTPERLKGVLAAMVAAKADPQVLTQLIGALALDPSVNVRLTALDALYPHASEDVVRAGVLASLPREQNPLVQVSMIDFLVAARDREAAGTLELLTRNATLDRSVREAAKRGLAQL